MRRNIFLLLLALAPGFAAAQAVEHALYLPPLDSSVVTLDASLKPASLENLEATSPGGAPTRRKGSREGRAARAFHPVFAAAVARAARRVEVIDSSAGAPGVPLQRLRLRRGEDTLLFALPLPTADSARFVLVLGSLRLSERSETLPRRFVSPKEAEYDYTTGTLDPGVRKGHSEGPGRFSTVEARAEWVVWDARERAVAHRGTALGASTARGEPTRPQWEAAARALARDMLRQTAFSPW